MQEKDAISDFERAINRNNLENGSNTPDFVLAEYLMDCLKAYEKIHDANEKWYGKELRIGPGLFEPRESEETPKESGGEVMKAGDEVQPGKRTDDGYLKMHLSLTLRQSRWLDDRFDEARKNKEYKSPRERVEEYGIPSDAELQRRGEA